MLFNRVTELNNVKSFWLGSPSPQKKILGNLDHTNLDHNLLGTDHKNLFLILGFFKGTVLENLF